MMSEDIRWKQRFSSFKKAMKQLVDAMVLREERPLSVLEEQGVVQAFEYIHELAWKTLKDFMEDQSPSPIYGSKDAVRQAFRAGLLEDGEIWMEMIKSRNETSHTYDEKTKDKVVTAIVELYYPEFIKFEEKLGALCGSD